MKIAQAIPLSPGLRRVVYLRDLLRELVLRDLKAQYKSSLLGVAWSLLNPLLQLLVFTFLFRVVMPLGIERYPAFAFSGLLAWTWFQLSLMQATSAFTSHRELLRRPGFPVAILPVITVTAHLINMLIAMPLLFGVVLLNGGSLSLAMLALPLVMAVQFVLVLSFAYFLATANVLFRDTQHLIGVCLQLLFFLTPVFYSVQDRVPERYLHIYQLNPMVHIVGAYRDILIHGRLPDPAAILSVAVAGSVLLLAGHSVFSRMRDRFVEEL